MEGSQTSSRSLAAFRGSSALSWSAAARLGFWSLYSCWFRPPLVPVPTSKGSSRGRQSLCKSGTGIGRCMEWDRDGSIWSCQQKEAQRVFVGGGHHPLTLLATVYQFSELISALAMGWISLSKFICILSLKGSSPLFCFPQSTSFNFLLQMDSEAGFVGFGCLFLVYTLSFGIVCLLITLFDLINFLKFVLLSGGLVILFGIVFWSLREEISI